MKNIFLVDADDTVLDFHGAAAQAISYAFEKIGVEWKEGYAQEYAKLNAKLWEALERKELTREKLMEERFPQFLRHVGEATADGAACNRAYIHYLSTHPIYFDGAQNFLKKLREHGRVYIVTNGTAHIQKSRFEICRLNEYCDGIFVSELIGFDKPAKEFSDYVYAHIDGFEKSHSVWIGDSLSADIKCAINSATDSIWYNPKNKQLTGDIKPTHIAKDYNEVLRCLGIE